MTFPNDPLERSPKGDHNRRLSLGVDPDVFADAAGISTEELRRYELTGPDQHFDPAIAQRVGGALDKFEATVEPKVANGARPQSVAAVARVSEALRSPEFVDRLAVADPDFAAQLVSTELAAIDPAIQLASFGERARGSLREIVVGWRGAGDGEAQQEVIAIPPRLQN